MKYLNENEKDLPECERTCRFDDEDLDHDLTKEEERDMKIEVLCITCVILLIMIGVLIVAMVMK